MAITKPVSGRFLLLRNAEVGMIGRLKGSSMAGPAGLAAQKRHFMSQPGIAGAKCRLRTWERGRPARNGPKARLIVHAGGTPALPGRANPGNPASGSRQPGVGQYLVVLSKTLRVRV